MPSFMIRAKPAPHPDSTTPRAHHGGDQQPARGIAPSAAAPAKPAKGSMSPRGDSGGPAAKTDGSLVEGADVPSLLQRALSSPRNYTGTEKAARRRVEDARGGKKNAKDDAEVFASQNIWATNANEEIGQALPVQDKKEKSMFFKGWRKK
mmetsp:Transcript_10883/g.27379  ORF Transcript_10883/g.27379 Transcript_10883/m.27379 type:complete len:150 (+) Transcript_10883:1-450(+)